MLCNKCQEIFTGSFWQDSTYDTILSHTRLHHDTESSLQKSAGENCFICWRLQNQWTVRHQKLEEGINLKEPNNAGIPFRSEYTLEPYPNSDQRIAIMFQLSNPKFSLLPCHFLFTPVQGSVPLLVYPSPLLIQSYKNKSNG